MSENRLAGETSPYLLQHKDNPVAWHPWGPEALEAARQENKPILLSVGYAACHWCHVMAHESFENETIAKLMNSLFINIKVDREERPDLDTIYQSSLALLGQQGGWPLTMFLTPAGEPFWGGTYFPPEPRYGRAGFPQVLDSIAEVYHREPEKVAKNVTALGEALTQLSQNHPGETVHLDVMDQVADHIVKQIDPVNGGIGGAPKFPQGSIFKLLWHAFRRTNQDSYQMAVELTLKRMCQGGIYDHLGGGFARYTVDERWLVPHFEKMLYDNAQLVDLLTWAWQDTRNPLYEARVRETVEWLFREMMAAEDEAGTRFCTAFASSLDADSEGEEGRFYVWSADEVDRLLGPDAESFKAVYDVTPRGNWEGKVILNRLANNDLLTPEAEMKLAVQRQVLLDARSSRIRPGWDDKVLADWNGMMIAALARAASVFGEPTWLEAAKRAFDFVVGTMTHEGRLMHCWRRGRLQHAATLDDYALMSDAALALFEATGDSLYLEATQRWIAILDAHYWDQEAGGYFLTADDAEGLIVRTKNAHDNATPSGNGVLVGVLSRLFYHTGKPYYRERAEAQTRAFSGELQRNFFPLSSLLNGAELYQAALQVMILGKRGEADTEALIQSTYSRSFPTLLLNVVGPEDAIPDSHPAFGRSQSDGRATAFVCRGQTCSLPITDPAELAKALGA